MSREGRNESGREVDLDLFGRLGEGGLGVC
jgi:hypothetical protein